MKCLLALIMITYSSPRIGGQCPSNLTHYSIKHCNESELTGGEVYIDFYQSRPPCTCRVIPYFKGEMLVKSQNIVQPCHTLININDSSNFYTVKCGPYEINFAVNMCQTVTVSLTSTPNSDQEQSYYCLGFQQKDTDIEKGNMRIICSNTTKTTINPTTETYEFSSVNPLNGINSSNTTMKVYSEHDEISFKDIMPEFAAGGGLVIIVVTVFICLRVRKGNHKNKLEGDQGPGSRNDTYLYPITLYHSSKPTYNVTNSTEHRTEVTIGVVPTQKNKLQNNTRTDDLNQDQGRPISIEVEHKRALSPQNLPYTDEYIPLNMMHAKTEKSD